MTAKKAVQEYLHDLCIVRLKENWVNDEEVSHIASAFLQVALPQKGRFMQKDQNAALVAHSAASLLADVCKLQNKDKNEHSYTATKTVLWEAVCLGWLSTKNRDEEEKFARSLISTHWKYGYDDHKIVARFLRERLEHGHDIERFKRFIALHQTGEECWVVRKVAHTLINVLELDKLAALVQK